MFAPRAIRPILMLAAVLLLGSSPAAAMQLRGSTDLDDQIDRVSREFERTQELLERVREMLQDNNSPRVRDLFQNAVKLQIQSKLVLDRAQTDSAPLTAGNLVREALSLTLRARDIGQRAGSLLREQVGLEEMARRTLERAGELLHRLSDASGSGDAQVGDLLGEARRQLLTARSHFADRNFEVALRLGESALKLLENLIDDSRGGGQGSRLAEEIERTERMLERARENADELDDAGRAMLRRASKLLDDAREAARRGQPRKAIRLVQESRKILRGLFDQETDGANADDMRRALSRFDAAHDRVLRLADRTDDPRVDELIARAVQARAEAVQSASDGDYDRALAQLRAGLDLLGRARRLAGGRR